MRNYVRLLALCGAISATFSVTSAQATVRDEVVRLVSHTEFLYDSALSHSTQSALIQQEALLLAGGSRSLLAFIERSNSGNWDFRIYKAVDTLEWQRDRLARELRAYQNAADLEDHLNRISRMLSDIRYQLNGSPPPVPNPGACISRPVASFFPCPQTGWDSQFMDNWSCGRGERLRRVISASCEWAPVNGPLHFGPPVVVYLNSNTARVSCVDARRQWAYSGYSCYNGVRAVGQIECCN